MEKFIVSKIEIFFKMGGWDLIVRFSNIEVNGNFVKDYFGKMEGLEMWFLWVEK